MIDINFEFDFEKILNKLNDGNLEDALNLLQSLGLIKEKYPCQICINKMALLKSSLIKGEKL